MNKKELNILDAESTFYAPITKPKFIVEGLIPSGLTLLCGAQKVGKSWLVLQLCLSVSKGEYLFGLPTLKGEVLYLSLEDTPSRIQNRLFQVTDEPNDSLKFANCSSQIATGLIDQLQNYIEKYPETKLIVIDTLQKIRTSSSDNMYAADYDDLSAIKSFADKNGISIVVVHHVRKQSDKDVFNKVSGTMGITGCADTTLILEKENRASEIASLYSIGRDIEYQEMKLKFTDCKWELLEIKDMEMLKQEAIPKELTEVVNFMADKEEWAGTATDLINEIKGIDVKPNIIGKYISQYNEEYLKPNNIEYHYHRTGSKRVIRLINRSLMTTNDNMTAPLGDKVEAAMKRLNTSKGEMLDG